MKLILKILTFFLPYLIFTAILMSVVAAFGEDDVALTIAYEASGEPLEAQVLVAKTILTRAEEWHKTPEQIVKQPYQFSCWNKGILPKLKKRSPIELQNAQKALQIALQSTNSLPSVTHYYSGNKAPKWAKALVFVKQVGKLKFYYEKRG